MSMDLHVIALLLCGVLLQGVSPTDVSCNLQACEQVVDGILNASDRCSKGELVYSTLKECLIDYEGRQCNKTVQQGLEPLVSRIKDAFYNCPNNLPYANQARAECDTPGIFICIGGLAEFIVISRVLQINDLTKLCDDIKVYTETLATCTNCIGGLFGSAWTAVAADVKKYTNLVQTLTDEACRCAISIAKEADKLKTQPPDRVCEVVETVGRFVEKIALTCANNILDTVYPFNWQATAVQYVNIAVGFVGASCFFAGGTSASTTVLLSFYAVLAAIGVHVAVSFLKKRR